MPASASPPPALTDPPWWAGPGLAVGLPVAVGALLAGHALDRWPVWTAELFTVMTARGDWANFYAEIASDRHPPLYFALARLCMQVADVDTLMRLPAALGAVLAVLGGAMAGLWWRGPLTAGLTGGLLALSPLLVAQAGHGRPYALVAAVGALLLGASLRMCTPGVRLRGPALALGLGTAAGLYLHYAAIGPALGAVAAVVAGTAPWSEGRWRPAAVAALAVGLGGLCFLPWALGPLQAQLAGVAPPGSPSLSVLRYLLFPIDAFTPVAGLALAVWAWLGLDQSLRRKQWALLAWGLSALALPLALSTSPEMNMRVYVHIGFLAPVALLAANGIHGLIQRPWLRGVAGGALLALHLPAVLHVAALPSSPAGPLGADYDRGVYDSRADALLLARVAPPGRKIIMGHDVPQGRYDRYAPGLFVAPEHASEGDWLATRIQDEDRLAPPDPCTFWTPFTFALTVPDPDECAALSSAFEGIDHGPYLLERAVRGRDLALAQRAARHSPASVLPAQWVARLALAQGQPEAASGWGRGLLAALRWNDGLGALALLQAKADVADALGDAATAEDARASARCLAANQLLQAPTWGLCFHRATRWYLSGR